MANYTNGSIQRLMKAIALVETEEECKALFDDLCTIKELQNMAMRLDTAILLSEGVNYLDISQQTGVECFGKLEEKDICETIRLAIESLRIVSDGPILVLSDLGLSETIINRAGLRNEKQKELFTILKEKKIHELEDLAAESGRQKRDDL